MFKTPISRRRAFGHVLAALAFSTIGSGAMATMVASDRQRSTAMLIRTIFPHAPLNDAFYAEAATTYLSELHQNGSRLAAFDQLVAMLNGSHIAAFADLPQVIRTSLVARVDQEPAFLALRQRAAEIVYRDKSVWRMIGYEGSAMEYGGYRDRGFDDIEWLSTTAKEKA